MALPSPPIPSYATKRSISAFAEDLAASLPFNPGDEIVLLIARLGGEISYRSEGVSPGRLPESIIVRSDHDFTIFVPTSTSVARDKFTICHELGHYFIHYPIVAKQKPGSSMIATRWVDESDKDLQRTEWEANWFAAAFLMPEKSFREVYQGTGNSLRAVASYFGVSTKAADVRKTTIGL